MADRAKTNAQLLDKLAELRRQNERLKKTIARLNKAVEKLRQSEEYYRRLAEVSPDAAELALRESEERFRNLADLLPQTVFEMDERGQLTKVLRQSEERFRSLVQNSSDIVTVLQADGTISYESPSIAHILGYRPEELVGKKVFEFVHPEDASNVFAVFSEGIQRPDIAVRVEFRFRHANGSWVYIESFSKNHLDDPIIQGVVVNSRDITERKRAELLQNAVYRISQAADRADNLNDLYKSVHEIIGTVMSTKNFYIAIYDPNSKLLTFPCFCDEYDERPVPKKLGKGLTEYVLRTAKPLLYDEAGDKELRQSGEVELIGTPSQIWLGVPLIIGDKAIGAMVVQDYSDPRAYGERELEMLEYVSSQVAKAIEKKQTEEALQESEVRYRTLVETSPDAITLTDSEHKILLCNQQCAAMHGFKTPEEMIGKSAYDLIAWEDRARAVENARKTLEEGGIRNAEYVFLKANGDKFPAELNASVIKDAQGNPVSFIAITRDITAHKRTEEALRSLSLTDGLTGLYNRRGFMTLAEQQWKLAKRMNSGMLLLFADIDDLKQINDAQGHQEGDLALIETANLLKGAFRDSDLVARVGGDEFAVLTMGVPEEIVDVIMARLQTTLEARNAQEDLRFKLGISTGAASYDPEHACSIDELLTQADALMYEHKRNKDG